jgi:hypothetical protein
MVAFPVDIFITWFMGAKKGGSVKHDRSSDVITTATKILLLTATSLRIFLCLNLFFTILGLVPMFLRD